MFHVMAGDLRDKEEQLMRCHLDRDAEGVETVPDDEVRDTLYTQSRYRDNVSLMYTILTLVRFQQAEKIKQVSAQVS